jgi:hypothetical protein
MQQGAIIYFRGKRSLGGESKSCSDAWLSPAFKMFDRLRSGEVDDDTFDLIFPPEVRRLSSFHWSPLECAVRAAEMCVPEPGTKVLDAGAGPGKFCLIGSLVTEGEFFGIEQRRTLVDTAREIAERYKISRVHFDCGNVIDFDWNPFDSIYLYNPFSENLDRSICIDDSCELFPELYISYIRAVQRKLADLGSGTRVVTLNGFGGDLPPSYELLHREGSDSLPLELWIQG